MVKNPPAHAGIIGDVGWIPGSERVLPGEGKWQPTAVFLPGKSHGQKSLVGYSPGGCKVRHNWALTHTHIYTCTHAHTHTHTHTCTHQVGPAVSTPALPASDFCGYCTDTASRNEQSFLAPQILLKVSLESSFCFWNAPGRECSVNIQTP